LIERNGGTRLDKRDIAAALAEHAASEHAASDG
jgi:hypothetical protein